MNYRHIYHAGGLLDLVKHITLTLILKRLVEKPAAFCVVDTHAGAGIYNLSLPEASKTGEAQEGFLKLAALPHAPAHAPFWQAVDAYNAGAARPTLYPGSPAFIRHFLRAGDRLVAIEKHVEEAAKLRGFFGEDRAVQIHVRDGFEALHGLLPAPEKRALVFCDPPYEKPDEMEAAVAAFEDAHARMSHAVMALWLPLKDAVQIGKVHEAFAAGPFAKVLRADVPFAARAEGGKVYGSGMIIINPPWKLDEELRQAYAALRPLLAKNAPPASVEFLKGN